MNEELKNLEKLNCLEALMLLAKYDTDKDTQLYIFRHLNKDVALKISEEICKYAYEQGLLSKDNKEFKS